ncbi:hypothetical protein Hamer_G026578 [Homarus americanus]|uniref:Uncharacterized protein n=1 Tax=Homarus americanus TaxID=6706 RepID=A0A8J5JNZ5_HOMAM|nr:hypothetical protein Hamer_G026578 [Homarus americanus]
MTLIECHYDNRGDLDKPREEYAGCETDQPICIKEDLSPGTCLSPLHVCRSKYIYSFTPPVLQYKNYVISDIGEKICVYIYDLDYI